MRYRWRVVSPVLPPEREPGDTARLAEATAAAEAFLLAVEDRDWGDVVIVFGQHEGSVPEWAPRVVGVHAGETVAWHPWPRHWCPGAELVAAAEPGELLSLDEPDGTAPGVLTGIAGDDLVVVVTDPDKPSRVARIAAQNADLYGDEAAGQRVPAGQVDAIPLSTRKVPAAIQAAPADPDQPQPGQAPA